MVRAKKPVHERSVGFNVSMPISWVEAIDKDCAGRSIGRSEWIRIAVTAHFPVLNSTEKLREFLNG